VVVILKKKKAAILKFPVAVGGFLSNDPLKQLMAIFILVSPIKSLIAPLRWWPSCKMATILKFQVAVACWWLIV